MPLSEIENRKENNSNTLLICIGLAILTFAAFERLRTNDFVYYDDDKYITANENVKNGLSLDSIKWAFTTLHQGNWHPLTWISHLIDVSIFGMNPAGHHLVNLGLHIINVILLFLILNKMTNAVWPSALAAALFGIHPLSVESVAWAAERKNVLSTFFAFLTIWSYLRYIKKPGLGRYIPVMVLFTAGLLSKSMLVTLPFALILLDYWPINRFANLKGWKWLWRSCLDKLPLIMLSSVFCVITYLAQIKAGAGTDAAALPIGMRTENAIISYVNYLIKICYPKNLAVLYPLNPGDYQLWKTAGCLLLIIAITLGIILLRHKYKFLFTGWFWYLGTLVPVIGLVQVGVQSMADRYMYLPAIGIYIITAWLAAEICARLHLSKIVPAVCAASILVILLMVTRVQAGYWKDSETLFRHALDVTKDNYVMFSNYGQVLRSKGRVDDSIFNFRKAVAIRPGWMEAHEKLGLTLQQKGEHAEAIEQFKIVLMSDPYNLSALNNLYKASEESGHFDKTLGIINGLQLKAPDNFKLYEKAGLIYGLKGNVDSAVEQLQKACLLSDYKMAEPMAYLSQAYAAKRDFKQAAEVAQKAIGIAQTKGQTDIVNQLKASLESYQQIKGN